MNIKLEKVKTLFKHTLKQEKGFTLIEMLIAIIIFILASVFITSLVTDAMNKPKEAGIRSVFSSYESSAQLLLLETSGNIPGADEQAWINELNATVDPSSAFTYSTTKGVSTLENAYGNVYEVDITKNTTTGNTGIVITSVGSKSTDIYTVALYYTDGEVLVGTKGFGRNDKKIADAKLTAITGGTILGAPVTP